MYNKNNKYLSIIFTAFLTVLLSGCFKSSSPAPVAKLGLNTKHSNETILIHKQDTIWSIAKYFNLPLQDIITTNNLNAPYELKAGQRIKLPQPTEYRVREKDTLYNISKVFQINIRDIVNINNLNTPYALYEGQTLRLPKNSIIPKTNNNIQTSQNNEYVPPYKNQNIAQESLAPPQKAYQNRNNQQPISTNPLPKQRVYQTSYNTGQTKNYNKNKPFIWPVKGRVLSNFGSKTSGLHNDGINIAVPRGTPVKSVSQGTVVYVGDDLNSFGNLVLIRHKEGWISAYGHLKDIKVKKGTNINQGQVIGTVGKTGNVTTPQLHFELRKGSTAINPQKYLS